MTNLETAAREVLRRVTWDEGCDCERCKAMDALQEALRSAAEPSADLPCKRGGSCASLNEVRQMCWPCQARWHRKTANEIEASLRADEKPPRIEPRGEPTRERSPLREYKCSSCGWGGTISMPGDVSAITCPQCRRSALNRGDERG